MDLVYNVGARAALEVEHTVRILIIEDETKVANALRTGLEAEHYEVTIAATGEEGFFLASQGSFDLLLLDLMLPRRGGLDVLATLRVNVAFRRRCSSLRRRTPLKTG